MNLLKSSDEPGCIAMKEEIVVNHSLFSISEKNALSTCSIRKIDAIVIAEMQKEKIELSSNEWKRNYVSSSTVIKQQSKNLRPNLSILN